MAVPSTIRAVETHEQTEMEKLTERLADTARKLDGTAHRLQDRVDSFMQQGQAAGVEPKEDEPTPGTLAALFYWAKRIDKHADHVADTTAGLSAVL